MTPEQKQRIEQIEARTKEGWQSINDQRESDYNLAQRLADIDGLLSLVKSQEAEMDSHLYQVAVRVLRWLYATMNPKAPIDKSLLRITQFEIHKELESAILNARAAQTHARNAATSMRSCCVEKVRAMIEEWGDPNSDLDDEVSGFRIDAANEIITALESVTIQEQEAKQS